jgi:hypothetical protein
MYISRVWIALEEKGVRYNTVKVDLDKRTKVFEPWVTEELHATTASYSMCSMLNAVNCVQDFTGLYQSASLNDHPGKVPVLIGMHDSAAKSCCRRVNVTPLQLGDNSSLGLPLQTVTLF